MFDSHAHVAAQEFDGDRDEVLRRALAQGLRGWMEVGTSVADSKKVVALANQHEEVIASVGVHPDEIKELDEPAWQLLSTLANDKKVKAIGEVGLDFYRDGKLEEQLPVLKQFISLAQEKKLPVIFHVRNGKDKDAHEELLKLLEIYSVTERPIGVIHTFSGTLAQAKQYVDMGMYISFSGVLTFKHAGELVEVAKQIPLESILVETDCPYLTPVPHRGERNEPAYVNFVIEKLAEVRGQHIQAVSAQILENTKTLFNF